MQKCVFCWLDVHTGESKVDLESKTLLVRDRWLLCSLWKIFPYIYRVNDGSGNGPALLQQVWYMYTVHITYCTYCVGAYKLIIKWIYIFMVMFRHNNSKFFCYFYLNFFFLSAFPRKSVVCSKNKANHKMLWSKWQA